MERAGWRTTAKRAVGTALAVATLAPTGCDRGGNAPHEASPRTSAEHRPAVLSSGAGPGRSPLPSASASPALGAHTALDAGTALPGNTRGCPDGMLRVEGQYCPDVLEECAKFHPDYVRHRDNKNISARCLEFRASRCFSDRLKHLAFCMDRYEYPDQAGKLPRVLTSWLEAQALCQREGKRLCTEDEFNFACEGPEMLPYATGYKRDANACNIDKPYIMPDHEHRMLHYDECRKDERCSKELRRLDQRHAIGSVNTCVSWAGVIDLNGNVNEWVTRPGEKSPRRGGLKGGWWGPVRDRCRPTVIFHKEFDYGYEAGFRCCKDLAGQQAGRATEARAGRGGPHPDAGVPTAASAAGGG